MLTHEGVKFCTIRRQPRWSEGMSHLGSPCLVSHTAIPLLQPSRVSFLALFSSQAPIFSWQGVDIILLARLEIRKMKMGKSSSKFISIQ